MVPVCCGARENSLRHARRRRSPCRPVRRAVSSGAGGDWGRKGTKGVSTNGVTANFMFFVSVFWGTPVNLLLSSKKCQGKFINELLLQRPP